jgi:TolB protein
MRKRNMIIAAVLTAFVMATHAQGTKPGGLQHFQAQCSLLLAQGGKWKTPNQSYQAQDEWSPRYFGYAFAAGIHPNTLLLKITGYMPRQSAWLTFWDGFYTWDVKKQKLVYHSVNAMGAVATGESERIGPSEISLLFTIVQPDGKVEKHRDVQKLEGDTVKSDSYVQTAGKWQPKNRFVWSRLEQPGGNLTFMSTRDGNFEVYSMDAKGGNLKNLTCNKATDYAFSATPDGRLVFYSNRDGNDEVYIQSADGKKATNLTNHPAADRITCVSPDGKKIAFSSNRDHGAGEIYVMEIDGGNLKRLTHNDNFEDAPTWSPDGRQIIFSRDIKGASDSTSRAASNGEIFIMDADGGNARRLTDRPGFDGGPSFSPDGKRIAFYGKTAEGNYEIFVMDADGGNITNLTEDPLEDYSPSWSPDGQWIAYTKGDSSNYDVWLIHLATGIKTRLTTQPKRDESPFWMPAK